jgi:hypothetical protein
VHATERPASRRLQFRLGSLLLLMTVAGCVAGIWGPLLVRWLFPPVAVPPTSFRLQRSTIPDDLDAYYLEPAETPLR